MDARNLQITIPHAPIFFTLYADGKEDTIVNTDTGSVLYYPDNAIILLYYTFPTHRRLYCVRNTECSIMSDLPSVSLPVSILFKQFASRVDKTKKAISYLREHYHEHAYNLPNGFYSRLGLMLSQKGKLNYLLLDDLVKRSLTDGRTRNA